MISSGGQPRILHWNIHSWRGQDGTSNVGAVAGLIRETAPHLVSQLCLSMGPPAGPGAMIQQALPHMTPDDFAETIAILGLLGDPGESVPA